MKKMGVIRRFQWCLPCIIFMGVLMVNPAWSSWGVISPTDKYAWSENTGWINFNSTYGSVTVYSTHLDGYAWAESVGWIRLGDSTGGPYNNNSSSDWGVNKDGDGNLSGYAWSENAGWINFHPTHSQVTISTATGSFDGYAWGENIGYIHFKNASPAYNVSIIPPTVTTGSASSVTTNSAMLNGTVIANGTPATAWFQYGTVSGSYTGTTTMQAVSGTNITAVSIGISSLSSGTTYYYRIAASNSVGMSTGSETSFITTTPSSDGGGGGMKYTLTVSGVSPTGGATGVGTNTVVTATFSDNMNGDTLTTDTFKLSGGGSSVTGSVSTNGKKATFAPTSLLANNTTYTATITTGAQAANAAGTTLVSNYSWSFTTESDTAVSSPTPAVTASPLPTPVATSSPTPTPSPPPAAISAELHLSKEKAYLSGDTVVVTVADADRGTNASAADILTTALKVAGTTDFSGDLLLDMVENDVNSGTFLATIKTGTATIEGASSSTRSNIGTIKTVQGGTATVIYTDTAPDASTITKTLSFSSSDAILAFDAESYAVGSYAVVMYVDAEENSDHTQEETLPNHVIVETSSINRAWMRMTETGVDTGSFKGSILVSSDATLDNERIQASNGDTLTAGCTDEINTSGAPRWVTAVRRVISAESTPTPAATQSPTPVITATPTPEVCIAEKITLSSYRLKIMKKQRAEVTVTVMGKGDCPVEGAKVRVLYLVTNPNDRGLISVSRRSAVTDADGHAVFAIKAGNKTGKANLTFKTGSLKGARLIVKVVGKKGK